MERRPPGLILQLTGMKPQHLSLQGGGLTLQGWGGAAGYDSSGKWERLRIWIFREEGAPQSGGGGAAGSDESSGKRERRGSESSGRRRAAGSEPSARGSRRIVEGTRDAPVLSAEERSFWSTYNSSRTVTHGVVSLNAIVIGDPSVFLIIIFLEIKNLYWLPLVTVRYVFLGNGWPFLEHAELIIFFVSTSTKCSHKFTVS